MRGDSLDRQQRLLTLLDKRRAISVPDAARELDANVRTIYRDLHVLESTGTPVYQEREGRRARWRVVDGWAHRITLAFSFLDLVALSAACRAMEVHGPLHEAASRALRRLREKLPADLAQRADRALERVTGARLVAMSSVRAEKLDCLSHALETDETVRLLHLKRGAKRARLYTVDPYRLVVQAQGTYVFGWCHERRAARIFALEGTRSIEGTGRYFERRPEVNPDSMLHGALGPWAGRAVEVRLRFAREAVPFLAPERVHETMKVQQRSDGGADATLRVPLAPGLVRWLLWWGGDVRVLAPAKLATRVREEHERAAKAFDFA